jgi:hypothetical protein
VKIQEMCQNNVKKEQFTRKLEFQNKINKILIDSPNETSKKADTMIQVLVVSLTEENKSGKIITMNGGNCTS